MFIKHIFFKLNKKVFRKDYSNVPICYDDFHLNINQRELNFQLNFKRKIAFLTSFIRLSFFFFYKEQPAVF